MEITQFINDPVQRDTDDDLPNKQKNFTKSSRWIKVIQNAKDIKAPKNSRKRCYYLNSETKGQLNC